VEEDGEGCQLRASHPIDDTGIGLWMGTLGRGWAEGCLGDVSGIRVFQDAEAEVTLGSNSNPSSRIVA